MRPRCARRAIYRVGQCANVRLAQLAQRERLLQRQADNGAACSVRRLAKRAVAQKQPLARHGGDACPGQQLRVEFVKTLDLLCQQRGRAR